MRRDPRPSRVLSLDDIPGRNGHGAREPPLLLPSSNMVFNSFGPENEFFATAVADAEPVLAWVQMQRESLAPGGFGAAIHAAADSGELTEEEAPIVARSLLTDGVDTTVSGIGAAVYCLARFPEQFAQLCADPSRARAAFEEAVRYETLVQTFFRTTTREVEIGDVAFGEGEKMVMFLDAANRDPRQWDRPGDYDIARKVVGHVGFSNVIHTSIGVTLARLEGEWLLSAPARMVAAIKIAGPPGGVTTTHCAAWRACRSCSIRPDRVLGQHIRRARDEPNSKGERGRQQHRAPGPGATFDRWLSVTHLRLQHGRPCRGGRRARRRPAPAGRIPKGR
jgi:hypothetical protein